MTTYKQKFDQLIQTSVKTASERFLEDGMLPGITWLIEDKHDIRIMIRFAPDIPKADMLKQMRKIAKDKEIVRYVVETEAWMAIVTDPQDMRRPTERPDKMEAIVISGQDRQNNSRCIAIEIERKGDKHFLGEPLEGDYAGGEFKLFEDGEVQ